MSSLFNQVRAKRHEKGRRSKTCILGCVLIIPQRVFQKRPMLGNDFRGPWPNPNGAQNNMESTQIWVPAPAAKLRRRWGYAGNMHGIRMVHAWNMHGILMGYAWNMSGRCMEYLWDMHGICMEYAWSMYGASME